ncbi:hypothetical protein [Streptomyces sp. NPDC014733]|uniref:hypothetical protein n=1 Tax=Streptomyces sp. NPDC014733 TaxID=3364885 RepID=UPI0036F890F3
MVPLAEAWDLGASRWSAARRQACANDLDAPRSLATVTAKTNRIKADQDPAQWMPPAAEARCTYLTDWTSTKLRWALTIDHTEGDAPRHLVATCPATEITYTPPDPGTVRRPWSAVLLPLGHRVSWRS